MNALGRMCTGKEGICQLCQLERMSPRHVEGPKGFVPREVRKGHPRGILSFLQDWDIDSLYRMDDTKEEEEEAEEEEGRRGEVHSPAAAKVLLF